jgi:DNA repair protein SbcC/Rad50
MRPLELTIEGFRSYRERVTFDWRGRRLVGIVGPIGSGKSSILDAVSFALYGKTPQVEGATKSLIHQLADQSHVELRFQVDGQVWRAVRSLRRKGASGHQLELLADDTPDAQVLEVVTLEGAMNERIEQVLGMDFKTFCRSVLLAQNRFSEFLKATPAQRDAVLKGVFGFERLDDALRVAKMHVERIDLELASLGKERERIIEAREHLDEARATAERSRERLHALESAGPEIERLEKERDAAEGDAASAVARMATLAEIAGTLPAETDIASPIAASRDAGAQVAAAETVVREADEARAACEAELARVASLHGNREQFRSFANLVETHERHVAEVERTQTAVDGAREELDEARAVEGARIAAASAAAEALSLANEALTAAATDVGAARTALMAATHAEMAHELRGTLVAAEPCPVCAQVVHRVPKAGAAPKVKAAESALAKAEKTEAKARTERDRCAGTDASARTSVDEAGAGIGRGEAALAQALDTAAAATASLTATKDQLVGWLGEEGDPRSLFEAREAELTAAERAVEAGHRAVEAARAGLDEAARLAEGASAAIAAMANRLSGVWGRLEEDRDVAVEPEAIESAYAAIREELVTRHERATAERDVATARVDDAARARLEVLRSVELGPDDDFRRALAEAGVVHGTAGARVTELEERIASANDLERTILDLEARRDIAKRLAGDLQPSRFLGFLLEEERAELAELGSDHFSELTDGSYRFTDDDRFDIVDLNAANTKRKADSLSGGETFLASLALALALAEMVARGGGRLDSFFLDEGFGSLDPQHLDLAMDGIGRLVSENERRLVVLVSHVAEMRDAIEDLVVLDKDDVTGDTIVRSGAGPAA